MGAHVEYDTSWARRPAAQAVREGIISFALGPIIEHYTCPRAVGIEIFDSLERPAIFAANHSSHLDTPSILLAMPREWRRTTAVAAAADYFYRNRLVAWAVTLAFGTVPIERRGGASQATARRIQNLLAEKWSLLLYPEGTRSRDGSMARVRAGASFFAFEHGVPLVPLYVDGTHAAMPVGRPWPRRHPVTVNFGEPLHPDAHGDTKTLTLALEKALHAMRDRALG